MSLLSAESYVVKPLPVKAVFITAENFLTVVSELRDAGYLMSVNFDDEDRHYHAEVGGRGLRRSIGFNDGEYLIFDSNDSVVESLSSSAFGQKYQKA
ncbi:hypothetical protein [Aeromicrobium sp. 179-A 4D2 NHS]|uniref:hypothetical protein n=1 Tax=Aeromicrobium sp. 179-A 4D2 NHS TaxID=3142375 RepID=UPI00399FCF9B